MENQDDLVDDKSQILKQLKKRPWVDTTNQECQSTEAKKKSKLKHNVKSTLESTITTLLVTEGESEGKIF